MSATAQRPPDDAQPDVRYCGRTFSAAEIEVIRQLVGALPTRKAIADAVCDAFDWMRPDGRPKR